MRLDFEEAAGNEDQLLLAALRKAHGAGLEAREQRGVPRSDAELAFLAGATTNSASPEKIASSALTMSQ